MNIKQFTFSAHQSIQALLDTPFKRTHTYELIATAFGYKSYASINSDTLFYIAPDSILPDIDAVTARCLTLGYLPSVTRIISSTLTSELVNNKIGLRDIHNLINQLNGDDEFYDDMDNLKPEYQITQGLIDSLLLSAERRSSLAHYALALIYEPEDEYDDFLEPKISSYWYDQQKAGRELIGVQLEWANEYEQSITGTECVEDSKLSEHHLISSAQLGNHQAIQYLANKIVEGDQLTDSVKWLSLAAELGDVDSIRYLLEEEKVSSLLTSWKWIYLAQMLGTDLTRDDYHAINEGGNLYVGGTPGISLTALTQTDDSTAQSLAKELHSVIMQNT